MKKWCGPPHEPQYLCGAYARSTGNPCRRFGNKKNGRCKLHGGRSTGAKQPQIKSGKYTNEAINSLEYYSEFLKQSKRLMELLDT